MLCLSGLKGVLGSLIFGGYDNARMISNNVTFTQGPDTNYPFLASLQSISTSNTTELLDPSFKSSYIYIDSATPYLWLPKATCQNFERAFGLVWNETTEFYTMNSSLAQSFDNLSPSFVFKLADMKDEQAIEITLPAQAFNHELDARLVGETSSQRYFPLKRLPFGGQPTLGRVFLQEA